MQTAGFILMLATGVLLFFDQDRRGKTNSWVDDQTTLQN
jgi:hypothetical protein